jgi:hypothetical protein
MANERINVSEVRGDSCIQTTTVSWLCSLSTVHYFSPFHRCGKASQEVISSLSSCPILITRCSYNLADLKSVLRGSIRIKRA